MVARYSVRSSESAGSVVASFQTSVGSDAFSIAADCHLRAESAGDISAADARTGPLFSADNCVLDLES